MLVVLPTGKITDERTTYGLLDTYRLDGTRDCRRGATHTVTEFS
jgi:hypothetical protein